MKYQVLQSCAGLTFAFRAGAIVEIDDPLLAYDLMRGNLITPMTESKPVLVPEAAPLMTTSKKKYTRKATKHEDA